MARWLSIALLGAGLLCSTAARAQSESGVGPVRGSEEIEFWLAQSHVMSFLSNGRTGNFLELGGRYGWVLTPNFGLGPLRGNLEYAFDVVPVIVAFQSTDLTYGIGVNPFVLKWNFQPHHNIVPFAEANGGGIATVGRVPVGGAHYNYTAAGGLGVQFLQHRHVWTVDFRFFHISDGHTLSNDPTYNMFQLRVGFGIFRHAG